MPTTGSWKASRVKDVGLSEDTYEFQQIKLKKEICKAFYELPGSKSRLFMGCQAFELNRLTKPFKMGLQLTNRRFNFDKFRVCKRLTCQTFGGSYQDYLDRSGLVDEGRLTRGFR